MTDRVRKLIDAIRTEIEQHHRDEVDAGGALPYDEYDIIAKHIQALFDGVEHSAVKRVENYHVICESKNKLRAAALQVLNNCVEIQGSQVLVAIRTSDYSELASAAGFLP